MPAAVGPDVAGDSRTEQLLVAYRWRVAALTCSSQGKGLRLQAAERFVGRFGDLESWMARPTAARLVDVGRTGAWTFLTWCFVAGAVIPDVDTTMTPSATRLTYTHVIPTGTT